MISKVNGNILNSTGGHIIQCINCQGVMGAGLAKSIAERYPKVYEDYKSYIKYNNLFSSSKSKLKLLGSVIHTPVSEYLTIHSIFGQLYYGRDGQRYVDYKAMMDGFEAVKSYALNSKEYKKDSIINPVNIPYNIGCGLAGGSWNVMSEIIELYFDDYKDGCYIIKYDS